MSKSDVDMEDAEKLPSNSENKVQEFTSKVVDAKIENREKNSPSETIVQGEVNTSEGDGQYLDKSRNEDKKNTEVKTGVIDQSDPQIEANEPIEGDGQDLDKSRNEDKKNTEVKTEVIDQSDPQIDANEPIEGSDPAKIIIKSENGELYNAHTEAEEQTASRSAFEKLSDPKGEVVDQNGTSGVEVENSTENGIEGGNYVESVEEMNNQDVAEDKLKEIGNEDANYVEPVVGGEKTSENSDAGNGAIENRQLPTEITAREAPQRQNAELNEARHSEGAEREPAAYLDRDRTVKHELEKQGKETDDVNCETDGNAYTIETAVKRDGKDSSLSNQPEAATPISHVRHYPAKAENYSAETIRNVFTPATLPLMGESDDGTPEDQTAFMKEIESFYRGRSMEFKPPKFYGQPLNCLKLWRAVIRLGGYDRVTGSKLWRQVGESFHPPKTCTTVSWTFRIFYEKSLLEYERHKTQTGELQLPAATLPEASGVDGEGNGYQGSGSGRARRDAAARAMQGWHTQQLFGNGEDKDLINTGKREKNLKSIGSHKQKRPSEVEHSNKAARVESSKQLSLVVVTSVVDVGPPADWVKINVRRNKDCFEVYALVPGLLREEVRVQSDPAGRLVITGQPEQVDNPWGITPFKKVVSLPARIDPLQTSAVVSLHGRLFVRVPFEKTTRA